MASFFCKLFTTTKKKFNWHIRKSGSLYFSREIEWRFTYILYTYFNREWCFIYFHREWFLIYFSREWCFIYFHREWYLIYFSREWCFIYFSREWYLIYFSREWCFIYFSREWCFIYFNRECPFIYLVESSICRIPPGTKLTQQEPAKIITLSRQIQTPGGNCVQ